MTLLISCWRAAFCKHTVWSAHSHDIIRFHPAYSKWGKSLLELKRSRKASTWDPWYNSAIVLALSTCLYPNQITYVQTIQTSNNLFGSILSTRHLMFWVIKYACVLLCLFGHVKLHTKGVGSISVPPLLSSAGVNTQAMFSSSSNCDLYQTFHSACLWKTLPLIQFLMVKALTFLSCWCNPPNLQCICD